MTATECVPWEDGYYRWESTKRLAFLVSGETVKTEKFQGKIDEKHEFGTWKYGEFEETRPEIEEATGKKNYNVEITMFDSMWKTKGVVSDDGRKITVWNLSNEIDFFERINEKEYLDLKNYGEPENAPTHHYKVQPDFQGRLIWISGAPGLGKSTTSHLLGQKADYVNYEGDAFFAHLNPYLPPDAKEPTLATGKQIPLKDIPIDRLDAVTKGIKEFEKWRKGEEYDEEGMKELYSAMCKNIKRERKRIGGNWVIAQAVPMRWLRDHIKKELGPDLTFVVLNMEKEEQMKRILSRHGGENNSVTEWLITIFDKFQPLQPDEQNAIECLVTNDMSREDVVAKVLELVS